MILHITQRDEWRNAQRLGQYRTPSLESDGFIHCSTAGQFAAVANAFYRGQPDLVLLIIDERSLQAEIRWEAPAAPPAQGISGSDLFPHIYGPINLDAVLHILPLEPDSAGKFTSPHLSTDY